MSEKHRCPSCGSANVERYRTTSPIPDAGMCQDCPRNGVIGDFEVSDDA